MDKLTLLFKKFLSEYGYNLIESEENKYLDLTRQVGNMKVQISFEAREPFADNSEHEHTEECNRKLLLFLV